MVKNPPVNARDGTDVSLIPGSGRSPGVGHGNPLQYFLPGKLHRGTWGTTVHGITKSQKRLSD